MKRAVIVVAVLVATWLATPSEAQGRFWVLVNGALRYNGPVTAASYGFPAGTASGVTGPTGASLNLLGATSTTVRIGNADGVPLTVGGSTIVMANKIATYNNVNTAGWGVPAIQAAGRATAQAAANASVATYTVGAADGSFEVSANVLVTTATTHTFTVECAYTDEGNTARTATFLFELIAGTTTSSVVNTNGAVPYEGIPLHIRAKAATSITIRTQAAGTYTSVVYNIEGIIKQTA